MVVVASLPAVQRDLFLTRCIRRESDQPESVQTQRIEWFDMIVEFATDSAITEASVAVDQEISIAQFSMRMESLLDCGTKTEGAAEWVLKFSAPISNYGSTDEVRRLLCDKIASLNPDGETVGVLKIKRRSVNSGHAKIRISPAEDLFQLVCRHITAQGLKSVWKSVLWRLSPQRGEAEDGFARLERWATKVHSYDTSHVSWEIFPTGVRLGWILGSEDPWQLKAVQDNLGSSNRESGTGHAALAEKISGRSTRLVKSKEEKLLLLF